MVEPRLKAGLWVKMALRMSDRDGRPAVVLRKGDADSGGVLVVLRQPEEPGEIMQRLSTGEAAAAALGDEATELRTYGVGAQILLDLGVTRMRVLSQPKKMFGISGFGLEVVEYVTPD